MNSLFGGILLNSLYILYLKWLGSSIFEIEGSIDPVSLAIAARAPWSLPLFATISADGGWKWTDFETNST